MYKPQEEETKTLNVSDKKQIDAVREYTNSAVEIKPIPKSKEVISSTDSAGEEDECSESEHEDDVPNNFMSSYMEIFKDKKFTKPLLPAPLEIIAKTGYTYDEPIQTGAPINFYKLEKLNGGKNIPNEKLLLTKMERTRPEVLGNCKPEVL